MSMFNTSKSLKAPLLLVSGLLLAASLSALSFVEETVEINLVS